MANGMEMLVSAILKAAGVDPDKVKEDVARYAKQLADKIASMDTALADLKQDQSVLIDNIVELTGLVEEVRATQTILSDLVYEIARRPTQLTKSDEMPAAVNGGARHDS